MYPVLSLNHRQQWRGIEDAPVTNTLLFHLPAGEKVSLGAMIVNDTRGLLATNSFDATIGYRVPLSTFDHNIRFGLTAGVGMNSFDVARLGDPAVQDPALLANLDTYTYLRGKFGLLYNYKGFNLGFSVPSLFKDQLQSPSSFGEIVFDPLSDYYAFASVMIPLGDQLAFEPIVAYRSFATGSQYEVAAVIHAMDLVWVGGSYRQNSGPTGVFGFTISDRLDFGYAYELASNQVNGFTNGTHELQLSIRVGKKKELTPKKKKEKKEQKEETPPPIDDKPVEEKVVVEEEKQAEKKEVLIPVDSIETKFDENSKLRPVIVAETEEQPNEEPVPVRKDNDVVKRGKHMLELPAGHYVMIGAFKSLDNAQSYSDKVFTKGYHETSFGYLSGRKYYYVWIKKSASASSARKERDIFRKMRSFKDAWYMEVKE